MFGWIGKWYASRDRDKETGIRNFGEVVPGLYRGAAPTKREHVQALVKEYGIRTILDLRDKPGPDEEAWCALAGVRYVNDPFSDRESPDPQRVYEAGLVIENLGNRPLFFHCEGGRHRTGIFAMIYRLNMGWSFERAKKEADDYGYYDARGHKPLMDFVREYAKKIARRA